MMPEIDIGGRKIPMLLSVEETAVIQEEIGCTVLQIRDEVFGIEHDIETDMYRMTMREDSKKMRKFGKLIRILGNAGLEERGEEPDLTDKWILRHIKPGMLVLYVTLVNELINDAMKMESATPVDGPVDEILAEENRKKERES